MHESRVLFKFEITTVYLIKYRELKLNLTNQNRISEYEYAKNLTS